MMTSEGDEKKLVTSSFKLTSFKERSQSSLGGELLACLIVITTPDLLCAMMREF
jgi:hypothetical protein